MIRPMAKKLLEIAAIIIAHLNRLIISSFSCLTERVSDHFQEVYRLPEI
jgi:hypothetical protein